MPTISFSDNFQNGRSIQMNHILGRANQPTKFVLVGVFTKSQFCPQTRSKLFIEKGHTKHTKLCLTTLVTSPPARLQSVGAGIGDPLAHKELRFKATCFVVCCVSTVARVPSIGVKVFCERCVVVEVIAVTSRVGRAMLPRPTRHWVSQRCVGAIGVLSPGVGESAVDNDTFGIGRGTCRAV